MMKTKSWLALISGCSLVMVTLSGCMVSDRISDQEKVFQQRQTELDGHMNAKGKVIYSIQDVPEGSVIKITDLEVREIEVSKIPQDAITSASLAVGRKARYGISTGQIIGKHDLAPNTSRSK